MGAPQALPLNSRRFEYLMYGAMLLTLVAAPFNPRFYLAVQKFGPVDLAVAAIAFGMFALIIWAIARKRQNWLRWTMAFLFVISLPISIRDDLIMVSPDPLNAWLSLLTILIMGAAYYFVFTGDAVPWFRRRATISGLR